MKLKLMAAAAALAMSGTAQAAMVNGGFESGLSGWTTNAGSLADTVSSHAGDFSTYNPVEGNAFARLQAGLGTGVYSLLSQTFSLAAGESVTGSAAYDARDYLPYNDDAYVRILQGNVVLFYSDVTTVGTSGDGPWTAFNFTALTGGTYTLEAGVRNTLDNVGSPYLLLDGVGGGMGAVPEPAAWLTMILGFGVVGGALRASRKRRTNVVYA